jgi:hypothetical protein
MSRKEILALSIFCVLFFGFLIIFPLFHQIPFISKSAQADTSGNGITKNVIVFECSYGDVTFTHKKHNVNYKIDCYDSKCHHTWDKDKQQKSGDLCRDCHKKQAEGNTPSKKDAFHKSCKGCHEDRKKENKSTGPTACKECHKKK